MEVVGHGLPRGCRVGVDQRLGALLLDRAGVWQKSHWIARHALEDDWHREWPRGENHKKWLLAYPRGYLNVLVPAAREGSLCCRALLRARGLDWEP